MSYDDSAQEAVFAKHDGWPWTGLPYVDEITFAWGITAENQVLQIKSGDLDIIVLRCLARDPAQRPADAGGVLAGILTWWLIKRQLDPMVAACAALARAQHDIVFMDCHMPVMDGYEASLALREVERLCGARPVPIVALTANALEGARERCLAAGMNDHLAKPFTRLQLVERLRRWSQAQAETGLFDA